MINYPLSKYVYVERGKQK